MNSSSSTLFIGSSKLKSPTRLAWPSQGKRSAWPTHALAATLLPPAKINSLDVLKKLLPTAVVLPLPQPLEPPLVIPIRLSLQSRDPFCAPPMSCSNRLWRPRLSSHRLRTKLWSRGSDPSKLSSSISTSGSTPWSEDHFDTARATGGSNPISFAVSFLRGGISFLRWTQYRHAYQGNDLGNSRSSVDII